MKFNWVNEWFLRIKQFFSYIRGRTSYIWWDNVDVHFVEDQHAYMGFHNASSLEQQSNGRQVSPLVYIILIPIQPLFIWLLNAACLVRSNTSLFRCLWFDPTGVGTRDLTNDLTIKPSMRFCSHWVVVRHSNTK